MKVGRAACFFCSLSRISTNTHVLWMLMMEVYSPDSAMLLKGVELQRLTESDSHSENGGEGVGAVRASDGLYKSLVVWLQKIHWPVLAKATKRFESENECYWETFLWWWELHQWKSLKSGFQGVSLFFFYWGSNTSLNLKNIISNQIFSSNFNPVRHLRCECWTPEILWGCRLEFKQRKTFSKSSLL